MRRRLLGRPLGMLAASALISSATVVGAWAGAQLGVGVSVALPSLCTAELRRGGREIAVVCLHRAGFVLHARNRRSTGELVLIMGAFRAEIPPGERRRIAGSGGPSAGRLPVRWTSADGAVSTRDIGLELTPR